MEVNCVANPTSPSPPSPPPVLQAQRFMGLDIHKEYFVATAVNTAKQIVFGPHRIANKDLKPWIAKHITPRDAVVVEMTTNTYEMYDALVLHAHSVIVVHPPHVALIARAQVKTDRKAALTLAQLHSAGLLTGIWVPPKPVRELRALIAQRWKMVRLATVAKNRLQNVLHRHHFEPPDGSQPYHPKHKDWWLSLPVEGVEKMNLECDWETVEFAERQKKRIEEKLAEAAAHDDRLPLLLQITGFGLITATTLLAAIGDITRFPTAKQLVGYAGLGASVHDSGKLHATGRITKAGRRDLRHCLVEAAQTAARHHPRWKHEFQRLEPKLGKSKAYVAIARKLLIVVWHVLTEQTADTHADAVQVATAFYQFFHKNKIRNHLPGLRAMQFVRRGLDRIGLTDKVESFPHGHKRYKIPPLEPDPLPPPQPKQSLNR